MTCKGVPPRREDNACTCSGCFMCGETARASLGVEDTPENRLIGSLGYVVDCVCDIDWECLYGRHTSACGGLVPDA